MLSEQLVERLFFVLLIILLAVFMYYANRTPMLGEDEPLYYWYGKELSQFRLPIYKGGRPFIQPILIPLVFSVFFFFFGPSLALAKMIISIFAILTVFILYLIGKKTNVWLGIFSSLLVLLPSYFSHFSMLTYVEIPIAFFSALVMYTVMNIKDKKSAIIAGIVLLANK